MWKLESDNVEYSMFFWYINLVMKRFPTVLFFLLFAFFVPIGVSSAEKSTTVYFFYGQTCPHCQKAKLMLEQLEKDHPELKVEYAEIYYNGDNRNLFSAMIRAYGQEPDYVPAVIVGDFDPIVGWPEGNDKLVEEKIEYCLLSGCINPFTKLGPAAARMLNRGKEEITAQDDTKDYENDNIKESVDNPDESAGAGYDSETKGKSLELIGTAGSRIKIYKYIAADNYSTIEVDSSDSLQMAGQKLMIADNNDINNPMEIKSEPSEVIGKIREVNQHVRVDRIELKIENDRPVYNILVEQPAKLLGLIAINGRTELKIDAWENKVVESKRPWWSFLAAGFRKINF